MPSSMNSNSDHLNDHNDSTPDINTDDVVQVEALHRAKGIPDRYVTEDVASDILGMSKAWLRRSRWSGEFLDLEYVKYGSAVRYSLASLYAFARSRTVKNKSKPNEKIRENPSDIEEEK